jgi:hypothetical protein
MVGATVQPRLAQLVELLTVVGKTHVSSRHQEVPGSSPGAGIRIDAYCSYSHSLVEHSLVALAVCSPPLAGIRIDAYCLHPHSLVEHLLVALAVCSPPLAGIRIDAYCSHPHSLVEHLLVALAVCS